MKLLTTSFIVVLSLTLCSCAGLPVTFTGFIRDDNTGAKAGITNGTWFVKAPVTLDGGRTGFIQLSGK